MDLSGWLIFLADAAANGQVAEGAGDAGGGDSSIMPMVTMFALIGMMFYFLILRPQKAKEHRFRDMVANLKENDRVVTIGGIYGVVTNVQRDVDRITLRIDESNNTKIRVTSNAIGRVLTEDSDGDGKGADSQTKK